ncbi:hypothetical protein AK812_SmicGene39383 [Symbiodinium microadriaticum]|uniref:Uncharacterized protein n=1 Tax=Symbiodinium microadriaticum TaxID=2951 RepID=A0A1Q9CBC1_SYMMI|nr:hypothetical protein AK812_SmicGene39383 [Symbiodinium microadriaticum]
MRSALFTPVVCSSVLDNLCNYFSADWRGGMNSGFHRYPFWGMSTVEDLVTALRLWHDIAACSSTCRAWHAALKPFANPNDLCRRALRLTLLAPATSGLRSSSVRDAVDLVAMFAQIWWHGRCIVDMPSFQLRPVLVSSVELQSELREEEDDDLFDGPVGTLLNHHAPQMMDFAKKILPLPLAWKMIPRTLGVHSMSTQRFAICELTESDSTKDQSSAAAVQVDEEGNIQLLALDGARLLPIADETLSSVMGLQYVASTSGLHTRGVQPVSAGAPCGTPYCSRDERDCPFCRDRLQGRLGASQLGGRFRLNFLAASRVIILEVCFEVPSFFATSKDSDLLDQLRQLLPWNVEGSDSEEVESSAAYATDEDEDEDDDAAEEEEEEEEAEPEAMAGETPSAGGQSWQLAPGNLQARSPRLVHWCAGGPLEDVGANGGVDHAVSRHLGAGQRLDISSAPDEFETRNEAVLTIVGSGQFRISPRISLQKSLIYGWVAVAPEKAGIWQRIFAKRSEEGAAAHPSHPVTQEPPNGSQEPRKKET